MTLPFSKGTPICKVAREHAGGKVPLECLFDCSRNCAKEHKVASTNNMLKQVHGCLGTKDLNDWEEGFVKSLWERSQEAKRPDLLTPKQVERLEELWKKHFAG